MEKNVSPIDVIYMIALFCLGCWSLYEIIKFLI